MKDSLMKISPWKDSFLKHYSIKDNLWLAAFALAIFAMPEPSMSQSSSGDRGTVDAATAKKPQAMNQKTGSVKLDPRSSSTKKNTAKNELEGKEVARPKTLDIDPDEVGDTKLIEQSRTNIDFSESLIDGKMNAPSGFLIQGRLSQDLTRMVRLRTSFKPEMLKSTGIPDKDK